MFRGLAGIKGDWNGFDWESAVTYSWARTDDETRNVISNTLFQAALAKTTPDAYNPFNGGSQPNYSLGDASVSNLETIKSFLVNANRIGTTSLTTADLKFSKPDLFTLPAGGIGFAGGLEIRNETYEDNRDARLDGTITYTDIVTGIKYGTDIMGASPAPDVKADRTVSSAFVEFSVPVISDEMKIPLVQSVDLQLAARGESYSDFGDVVKPKVAGSWTVVDSFKFRSSWSQSFRAPNLAQFYSAGTQVANTRTDFAACRLNNTTCTGVSTLEVRAGNQNLKPEDAETLSIGFVFQPIRGLTLTVDQWTLDSDGVIGIQGAQNQILYDLLLRQSGKSNPNVVRLAPVGTQVVGDLSFVQDDYFNLGPRTLEGIDIGLSYELKTKKLGDFSFDLSGSKLTEFLQSASPLQQELIAANAAGRLGTGVTITQAGSQIQVNGNPEWRATANITWKKGPYSAGALASYVGPVFDTGTLLVNNQFYELKAMTTVAVYAQYRKDGFRARLGARNVFDQKPPLSSSNYGFLGSLHDAIGRNVYLELAKDF
jgi:outer membrane receptor protein involved in Fe transport